MEISAGFYKVTENNELIYAPNKVYNKDYILDRKTVSGTTFPVDGWYWFNTEKEAIKVLGYVKTEEEVIVPEV